MLANTVHKLIAVKTINIERATDTIVDHNHTGNLRDYGECPACDQFHAFYKSL